MAKPKPLVVIPTYMREEADIGVTHTAIQSVRKTAGESVDILAVDDASPMEGATDELYKRSNQTGAVPKLEVHCKYENTGFSHTVNVGLKQALQEGRDAVLLNADMEINTPGWVRHFRATQGQPGKQAGVVGALLMYPNGLIQHAGIYFSLLTRTFDHLYKYGPGNLPDALKPRICPVTGAFQYIRHSTLEKVGLYDENFKMGWEDVDYCIRVFLAGEQCVYNPSVRGFHHEMLFRGKPSEKIRDWQNKSFMYLCMKYAEQSFAEWVPQI
jgi:GT2 family glycosyltransferase